MYTQDDITSLYNFLNQTPEGALRKMLIGGNLTDLHFRVLMKLAKGAPEADFSEAFNSESMGKLRLSAKEEPVRETLWPISKAKFLSLGLIKKQGAA